MGAGKGYTWPVGRGSFRCSNGTVIPPGGEIPPGGITEDRAKELGLSETEAQPAVDQGEIESAKRLIVDLNGALAGARKANEDYAREVARLKAELADAMAAIEGLKELNGPPPAKPKGGRK